ncbi:putative IS5 transposase, ORFa [Porphyromonas gingivalis]|nr:putative IS5 transposase, ORFa [Porphyromonas gingivalis]
MRPIRTLINKKYTKRQNAIGAPAYDVILLFKMLLLETWYNLSDCALEERINDSITFSRFLGLWKRYLPTTAPSVDFVRH